GAPGKGWHIARFGFRELNCCERGARDLIILRRFPLPARKMRMASDQRRLQHRRGKRIIVVLRQNRAHARELATAPLAERPSGEVDATLGRDTQPSERVQQRRLASAIASQHGPTFAAPNRKIEAATDAPARDRYCETARLKQSRFGHRRSLASRYRNAGTPSSAVMTPTGNCVGATTSRESVSAMSSSAPPASTHAGRITR